MYWDGGAPAIQHFLSHHLKNCEDNYICNKIEMKDLEFDWDRPETPVDMSGGIAGNDDMGFESDNPCIRQRSRSLTQSPQRRKKTKINQLVLKTPSPVGNGPHRHGTSHGLFTIYDFLRLNCH
jgi:hypothetical protein